MPTYLIDSAAATACEVCHCMHAIWQHQRNAVLLRRGSTLWNSLPAAPNAAHGAVTNSIMMITVPQLARLAQ